MAYARVDSENRIIEWSYDKLDGFNVEFSNGEYIDRVCTNGVDDFIIKDGVAIYSPLERAPSISEVMLAVQIVSQNITDDATALSIKNVYPKWRDVIGAKVKEGYKFTYENKLYKVIQPELTLSQPPGQGTESLYARIDETHAGTLADPIPYNGNMELFNGKYYIQDEVIYICIRDSGAPLYHNLADLVGVYVNVYEAE